MPFTQEIFIESDYFIVSNIIALVL